MRSARTPIAVFAYDRPTHVERALRSLERCRRLDECDVHIFCDAAKNEGRATSVKDARSVIAKWAAGHEATVIERKSHLGCAHSIVAGVTELVSRYGQVIVLEDDLEVSPEFLNFLLQSLERYRNEPRVAQISALMFGIEIENRARPFFLPFAFPLGWATWDRAWKDFDWTAPGWDSARADPAICNQFDQDGSFEHCEILRATLNGEIDAWDILWEWNIFRQKQMVLYPPKSLIKVGGFDGSGTNCSTVMPSFYQLAADRFQREPLPGTLTWPEIGVDRDAYNQVTSLLKRERDLDASLMSRVQRKLQTYGRALRAAAQESL